MPVSETPVTLANLLTIAVALAALGTGFFSLLWRRQTDTGKKLEEMRVGYAGFEQRLDGRINLLDQKLSHSTERLATMGIDQDKALMQFYNALTVHADVMRGVSEMLKSKS